jgi:hypothetical protein
MRAGDERQAVICDLNIVKMEQKPSIEGGSESRSLSPGLGTTEAVRLVRACLYVDGSHIKDYGAFALIFQLLEISVYGHIRTAE